MLQGALVPELVSADAFVMVCRPVYRTNLTHVAALISFFRKGLVLVTVFVASKLVCVYSVVKGRVLVVTVFVASKLACLYSVVKGRVLVVTVFVASTVMCLYSVVKRELSDECGTLLPQFVTKETV